MTTTYCPRISVGLHPGRRTWRRACRRSGQVCGCWCKRGLSWWKDAAFSDSHAVAERGLVARPAVSGAQDPVHGWQLGKGLANLLHDLPQNTSTSAGFGYIRALTLPRLRDVYFVLVNRETRYAN